MSFRYAIPALVLWLVGAVPAGAEGPSGPSPAEGTLRVMPTGIEKNQGRVLFQLASTASEYDNDQAFRTAAVEVADEQAVAVFAGIPHGEYAIKLFHDANDNRELDTNFVGIPKEKFGFSNDALGRFGPPSFEQARFRFDSAESTIRIKLR